MLGRRSQTAFSHSSGLGQQVRASSFIVHSFRALQIKVPISSFFNSLFNAINLFDISISPKCPCDYQPPVSLQIHAAREKG
jgi:hypothetical protein